jgi:hypothetical protein
MIEYARNNKYFSTATDFRQSINHFFDETLHKIGNALASTINDNFQTFDFNQRMGIYAF